MRRPELWAVVVALVGAMILISGCKSGPAATPSSLSYEQLAAQFNARASQLDVIWARAVVSIEFMDEDGDRRWEQGNGHLQIIQPNQYALSIGKVGQVYVWIGADKHRFWLLDCESDHALVGHHADMTIERTRQIGVLTTPKDLPVLLGIKPLPVPPPSDRNSSHPTHRVSPAPGGYVVEYPLSQSSVRMFVTSNDYQPTQIELIDSSGEVFVAATLTDHADVSLPGRAGYFPKMASLITIDDRTTGSTLKMTLSDMQRREIAPEAFDLDYLLSAYGPFEIHLAGESQRSGVP